MLKKYKNELFKTLQEHVLGFNNFKIVESTEPDNNEIEVIYTPYEGVFAYSFIEDTETFDYFHVFGKAFSPNYPYLRRSAEAGYNFYTALQDFIYWTNDDLKSFIEDQNEIDLWSEYTKGLDLSDVSKIDYNDESYFNLDEIKQIRLGIDELKYIIPNRFTTAIEQNSLVLSRLEYLSEAVDRLSKRDWQGIFISTVIGIITTLSLDTEKGKELFELFLKLLHIIPLIDK